MSVIVDLFAGPGGWDVAARDLGMYPLGIEWDDAACATRKAAGLQTLQADVALTSPHDHPCTGLIASPPCQAWSMAGKGGGRRDKQYVVRCAAELAAGNDTRAEHRAQCEDERSILAVEPLRWALALRPEWCAFEQVPPVLELWTMFAQILAAQGYSTWAGVLEAERFGVPQTRERAILLASRVGPATPPVPTHQRYVPGEPQRHDASMFGEVLPWVSMAQALGWQEGPSPSPSPSVTGWRRRYWWRCGPVSVPTPTIASQGLAKGRDVWVTERPPSTEALRGDDWHENRPATTIAGDSRVFPPGGHHVPGDQSNGAVRVTAEQAVALQTFPPGYPFQGSRTKVFEQIGNAIPPLLAWHVLRAIAVDTRAEVAA